MTFAFYLNMISPHQLPLAREVARRVGINNFRYIYTEQLDEERKCMGWNEDDVKGLRIEQVSPENRLFLESVDFVYTGLRDLDLIKSRLDRQRAVAYYSERWFKPICGLPGSLRLFKPAYFKMAWILEHLLMRNNRMFYLPQGVHAACDMAQLSGLMSGDLRCMTSAPELEFERKPGGRICLKNGGDEKKYCLDKMRMWGYYVEPSKFDALSVQEASKSKPREIKVLWVGRLLNLKRVDTIVRAVGEHANLKRADNLLPKITLDIYGAGPEESRLKKMAAKYGDMIKFYPPVPIASVRKLMHEHDVYVLASNSYEGWGAVVCEALEEGMKVIGTYEAGASVAILPKSNLFHSGDWKALRKMLACGVPFVPIGEWSAKSAANRLFSELGL